MRLLQVCPRVAFPPSTARPFAHNLAAALARRHDVRQFAQAGVRFDPVGELDTRGWERQRYERRVHRNLLARALTELSEQAWVNAPILPGEALRLTRPVSLRALLRWAEVTVVEFPWQLAFCAAQPRAGPLVLDMHNVESVKFRSWARASRVDVRRPRTRRRAR